VGIPDCLRLKLKYLIKSGAMRRFLFTTAISEQTTQKRFFERVAKQTFKKSLGLVLSAKRCKLS
jgi:hypothetical protein